MSTYREKRIDEYINDNYPNAKIVNYNDHESNLIFYSDEELTNLEGDWFPLCCYRDEKTGKLLYGGRERVVHTYTEGETGAGKTTRFVMQSIRALSSTKGKPSFVIVDIHGEIIENLYSHLKNMGYDIKILNCDNPSRSDTYNPLGEIARECLEKRSIETDAINNIRRISEIMQPIEDTNDPIWYQGACAYTNGCILDKFEDLIQGDIPLSCITLYNIIQNHYWLRRELSDGLGCGNLFGINHYRKKQQDSLATQKMVSVTNNADKTRASYYGVVENHYDVFGQPSLYRLSSNSTINIRDFINKPTVIVIQSGNTKIGDDLISLMMNDIYTTVVRMGKASPTKLLPRKIHCFLDEFANCNIADGPEYIRMLTTSRKFGMYWHMILQCDAQLDRKFDANIGRIIRANSTELFMGSQDYDTEVRFAKSCGQKTVESLGSEIMQQMPSLVVVDLMTPEKLDLTEEGYVYVKTNRQHLLKSYIEAFYNCPEFERLNNIDDIYPHNDFDYKKTCFYPSDIPVCVYPEEYEILEYIGRQTVSVNELLSQFKEYDVKPILQELVNKDAIETVDSGIVASRITPEQLALLKFKLDNDCMGEPVKAKPNSKKKHHQQIDLFSDEPMYKKTNNPFVRDLIKHFVEKKIKINMSKLSGITCFPNVVKEILLFYSEEEKNVGSEYEGEFPANKSVLKFDIIEEYIRNHDFGDKDSWSDTILQEYLIIKDTGYFPDSILEVFEAASNEIRFNLTLKNIREIKALLSKPSGNDSANEGGAEDK